MKLIFVEYLASLKERGELDVIIPDLLSELGFNVLSRPAIGTRQHGVDVAAVGPDTDGEQKLFLLTIKPGDLNRSDWSASPQSLRSSLEEIIDVYVGKLVPKRYSHLPVRIVICLGGDLHEGVRANVDGFIDRHTNERITFDVWNGDRLADLLQSGVLRENALPKTWQSDFRKSLALVDEPEVSFRHFCRLVNGIADASKPNRPARLTAIRQIYLAVWTLYVWARDAENIEAAYLSSERALLISWPLIKNYLPGKSKLARQLKDAMERLISLHRIIAGHYLTSYVQPRAHLRHGLTSAVPSESSLDINLRLFEIVGRVGTQGLWLLHAIRCLDTKTRTEQAEIIRKQLQVIAQLLADIIWKNPILLTPIKDSQAIDINIACLFLNKVGCNHVFQLWIQQIAQATWFAYSSHGSYPCIFEDYRDLIEHPRKDDGYREKVTAGSLLVPTLAVWAAVTDDGETLGVLADFTDGSYAHSTLQLCYPGPDTEEHLYADSDKHGLACIGIKIERNPHDMLAPIISECGASTAFSSLSAVEYGLWPLVISASRHHRFPVPPHFWPFSDWATDNLQ